MYCRRNIKYCWNICGKNEKLAENSKNSSNLIFPISFKKVIFQILTTAKYNGVIQFSLSVKINNKLKTFF